MARVKRKWSHKATSVSVNFFSSILHNTSELWLNQKVDNVLSYSCCTCGWNGITELRSRGSSLCVGRCILMDRDNERWITPGGWKAASTFLYQRHFSSHLQFSTSPPIVLMLQNEINKYQRQGVFEFTWASTDVSPYNMATPESQRPFSCVIRAASMSSRPVVTSRL